MTLYSDKPDIMAIGDSLYQGIRSLSFVPSMTHWSVPAQVARSIGMTMTVPDLRQPLLFDLEALLRKGGLLDALTGIGAACLANLQSWPLDQPWSAHEAFDNISIGGAQIVSLGTETYASNLAVIPGLIAALKQGNQSQTALLGTIGDLWYAMNNCYILNPRHRQAQAGKTALDQVEDRQPSILLVNIGSNDGLFDAGFEGLVTDEAFNNLGKIPSLLRPVADRLKGLPARIERIVFNNLVRPRCVPNLMPSPAEQNSSPGDGYFAAYGPRAYSHQQGIMRDRMQALDELVAEVNAEVSDLMKSAVGDRLVIGDLYGASSLYDGKHYADRALSVRPDVPRIVNRPLEPDLFAPFSGGLTGLDNMHPTAPGYAAMADTVLDALGRHNVRTDKSAAYDADTLLHGFNGINVVIAQVELSWLGTVSAMRSSKSTLAAPAATAPAPAPATATATPEPALANG